MLHDAWMSAIAIREQKLFNNLLGFEQGFWKVSLSAYGIQLLKLPRTNSAECHHAGLLVSLRP